MLGQKQPELRRARAGPFGEVHPGSAWLGEFSLGDPSTVLLSLFPSVKFSEMAKKGHQYPVD